MSPSPRSSQPPLPSACLGLRVDVCTFQGLRGGVPRLLDLFARRAVQATFFVTLGPDCSGRAIARLWRKRGFASKMVRTGGLRLYGLRTALYGTVLPAPNVAARSGTVLRRLAASGHEVGLHAWNHVRWQDHLDAQAAAEIRSDYARAMEAFEDKVGRPPDCTAAPAWLASDTSLRVAEEFRFHYASDTRGRGPFLPCVGDRILETPQVPVTLPTLDERLGRHASVESFYSELGGLSFEGPAPVLVVHAELEGRSAASAFESFLEELDRRNIEVMPLGTLLDRTPQPLPRCPVARGFVEGRAGAVSLQGGEGDG